VFLYEHTANGDLLTITDPDLQLHQLEVVQREVADLMANGWIPAPAAGAVGSEAVAAAPATPAAAS
jgi:hypothetical protein